MSHYSLPLILAALLVPALAACGNDAANSNADTAAGVDRIIAKETRNARKPDTSRGLELRRTGFKPVFAGTAMQYGATFKQDNLIDLELSAHRLEGQEMLKSGAVMQNLPMGLGETTIDASKGDEAPGMTLTGVPGYETTPMRMNQGTLTIVKLHHEKDAFTGVPMIQGYEVNFDGHFIGFSDDPEQIVVNPGENRGVKISGSMRYHKD